MTDMFRDNGPAGRFELEVGGRQAFVLYRRDGDRLVIDHVEAEPALRGTGAAGRLMEQVVAAARAENLTIVPRCSYAARWLRRHQD